MQHDTSKVLRLPRKMTMDTSKVLATKTATHLLKTSQKPHVKPPKATPLAKQGTAIYGPHADGCGRLQRVVDGRERFGNVKRTHPQPPDPQSETGTLATHSGKHRYQVSWNCTSKKHQETMRTYAQTPSIWDICQKSPPRLMPFSCFGQIQEPVCMGHLPFHGPWRPLVRTDL